VWCKQTRLLQDKTSKERLERHLTEEVMLRVRSVLPDEAVSQENSHRASQRAQTQ
jgi:hypothetical protein